VEAVLESDAWWVSDKHKKAMKPLMGGLEPVLASATPKTEGASSKKKKRKRGYADEHEPQHEQREAEQRGGKDAPHCRLIAAPPAAR